jgi:uncharacterized membrane protein
MVYRLAVVITISMKTLIFAVVVLFNHVYRMLKTAAAVPWLSILNETFAVVLEFQAKFQVMMLAVVQ